MLSTRICEKYVNSLLAADSTMQALVGNRIYAYEASGSIVKGDRYVLFANLSALDVMGVGPRILMDNLLYIIRGVIEGPSFDPIEPVAERVHELLHGSAGTTEDGEVVACVRDRPFSLAETSGSRKFRHLGGVYRFYTIKQ